MTKTTNYQLNQWDADDYVRRTDFNEDNAKIESALSAMDGQLSALSSQVTETAAKGVSIAIGNYAGTGKYGSGNPNTLTFGFVPKMVVITTNTRGMQGHGTILLNGQTLSDGMGYIHNSDLGLRLTVTWSDKTVSWYSTSGSDMQLNYTSASYRYLAIG